MPVNVPFIYQNGDIAVPFRELCALSRPLNGKGRERQRARSVVAALTERGSDAGKVFFRASSIASSGPCAISTPSS